MLIVDYKFMDFKLDNQRQIKLYRLKNSYPRFVTPPKYAYKRNKSYVLHSM
jgi:hypothetical protein